MLGRAAQVIALLGGTFQGRVELAHAVVARLKTCELRAVCFDENPCAAGVMPASSIKRASLMAEHRLRIEQTAQNQDVLVVVQPLLMLALSFQEASQAGRHLASALGAQHHPTSHVLILDDTSKASIELEATLRHSLQQARCAYSVASGSAQARIEQVLMSIDHLLDAPQRLIRAANSPRWRWLCEKCDDGDCEHATKG